MITHTRPPAVAIHSVRPEGIMHVRMMVGGPPGLIAVYVSNHMIGFKGASCVSQGSVRHHGTPKAGLFWAHLHVVLVVSGYR
jgi:hypothetical protein